MTYPWSEMKVRIMNSQDVAPIVSFASSHSADRRLNVNSNSH